MFVSWRERCGQISLLSNPMVFSPTSLVKKTAVVGLGQNVIRGEVKTLRAMQRRAQSCLPNYFSARADTYALFSDQTVYSAHSPAHQILVKIRIG